VGTVIALGFNLAVVGAYAAGRQSILGDGGKPGERRQTRTHETQHGAATPGHGPRDQETQVLAERDQAAGNVAEPRLGPTGHRVEHPPTRVTYDPADARARGQLAEATYRRVSDSRVSLAAAFKLPEQLPFPLITPSTRPRAFMELLDRVREEGAAAPAACDRVVENLIAQARETRDVEWLSLKSFSTGAWTTARERVGKRPPKVERYGKVEAPSLPRPEFPPLVVTPLSAEERIALAAESRARLFGRSE
jgi:hypothetical protein